MKLQRFLPAIKWIKTYHRHTLSNDLFAALVMMIVFIPQSLAYAMLAGLPAQVGLYASIVPPVLYALFGTSSTLAVGPVAVTALMTAIALGGMVAPGSEEYMASALLLAVMSGFMLLLMGLLRLGFIANFLSHPVISGFVSASGLLIIASQLGNLFGIPVSGSNLLALCDSFLSGFSGLNIQTFLLGLGVLLFLAFARISMKTFLMKIGFPQAIANFMVRISPIVVLMITTLVVFFADLANEGVALIGNLPSSLPGLTLPSLDIGHWQDMALSALLISVVSFVSSVSVAQTFAVKRRERIDPNQELIALGVSNLSAGFSGGMPVSGGLSRSVISFDAGAQTPASGIFTAIGLSVIALTLSPLIAILPIATLAAIIMISAATLVDFPLMRRIWRYSKADSIAMLTTLLLTLLHSFEFGLIAGISLSLAIFLHRTSKPHIALLGRVPGTEHFRNELRYELELKPSLALLRVDESLYFANSRFLEGTILELINAKPNLRNVVLVCSGVNQIDTSALASLNIIHEHLIGVGIKLHLSEVKGPVMDRLQTTKFLEQLSGQVYLSTFEAWSALGNEEQ